MREGPFRRNGVLSIGVAVTWDFACWLFFRIALATAGVWH
jgi:hypothetical protein